MASSDRMPSRYKFGSFELNENGFHFIKRNRHHLPFLDKNELQKIVSAGGVPADTAGQVTSIIEKAVELALQDHRFEEFKLSFKRATAYTTGAGISLLVLGLGAIMMQQNKLHKLKLQK